MKENRGENNVTKNIFERRLLASNRAQGNEKVYFSKFLAP